MSPAEPLEDCPDWVVEEQSSAGPGIRKSIFFKKEMKTSRDFSLLCAEAVQPETFLELTAGLGVLSYRLRKTRIGRIIVNDSSKEAFSLFSEGLKAISDKYDFFCKDGKSFLFPQVDYVDIDPYDSPNSYFTNCLRFIKIPGHICVNYVLMKPDKTKICAYGKTKEQLFRIKLAELCQIARAQSLCFEVMAFYTESYWIKFLLRISRSNGCFEKVRVIAGREMAKYFPKSKQFKENYGPYWLGDLKNSCFSNSLDPSFGKKFFPFRTFREGFLHLENYEAPGGQLPMRVLYSLGYHPTPFSPIGFKL